MDESAVGGGADADCEEEAGCVGEAEEGGEREGDWRGG